MNFNKEFLKGAATAAHQVEGNNIYSDFWAMEHMDVTSFIEPSLDAVDHYNHYKEDIDLLKEVGLNAYRFSIEWARIEPVKGIYDKSEIDHYRSVLEYCHSCGVEPVVTMHHFSSPKWLIEEGGWESESLVQYFAEYCKYVVSELGDQMHYVCTINEANMGLQLSALIRDYMKQMTADLQVGISLDMKEKMEQAAKETAKVFGVDKAETFLSGRSERGDQLIGQAHVAARQAIKQVEPNIQVGITLSLHDFQPIEGGEAYAEKAWVEEFRHYLPYIEGDDFFGLQNYTRKLVDVNGTLPVPEGAERTQMGYEFYPKGVSNVIRKVYGELKLPIIVTENGIGTEVDSRRVAYIEEALEGISECIRDGIPVKGYMHWSLLDNFEWQKGYSITFGLIKVDRETQKRYPKESLKFLGQCFK